MRFLSGDEGSLLRDPCPVSSVLPFLTVEHRSSSTQILTTLACTDSQTSILVCNPGQLACNLL